MKQPRRPCCPRYPPGQAVINRPALPRLGRPCRPQLRTRVLAGVVAVTLAALAAFDFAAVSALRKYLVGHTDARLGTVVSLYRPVWAAVPSPGGGPHPGRCQP